MKILAIACGVLVILLGVSGWLLKNSYEANGKLTESNRQLTESLNAKTQATKGRAQVDRVVRDLAPADVLDRLR